MDDKLRRIIFLDFDGVLLNRNSWAAHSGLHGQADPACVAALNRILKVAGASVVVSSSWRLGSHLVQLKEHLQRWGVVGSVLGKTPFLGWSKRGVDIGRGHEIAAWLKEYEAVRTEVEFVVLDDDMDTAPVAHRHIHVNGEVGLTEQDADRALALFNCAAKGEGA